MIGSFHQKRRNDIFRSTVCWRSWYNEHNTTVFLWLLYTWRDIYTGIHWLSCNFQHMFIIRRYQSAFWQGCRAWVVSGAKYSSSIQFNCWTSPDLRPVSSSGLVSSSRSFKYRALKGCLSLPDILTSLLKCQWQCWPTYVSMYLLGGYHLISGGGGGGRVSGMDQNILFHIFFSLWSSRSIFFSSCLVIKSFISLIHLFISTISWRQLFISTVGRYKLFILLSSCLKLFI